MEGTTARVKPRPETFERNFAFFTLLRAAPEIVTSGDRVLRNADAKLTIREFDVPAYAGAAGPNRPRDLLKDSALVGNPQSLSSVLDRLDRHDMVSRVPSESDSRSVEVSITDQGLEQLDVLFPLLSEMLVESHSLHHTEEENSELCRLLEGLWLASRRQWLW